MHFLIFCVITYFPPSFVKSFLKKSGTLFHDLSLLAKVLVPPFMGFTGGSSCKPFLFLSSFNSFCIELLLTISSLLIITSLPIIPFNRSKKNSPQNCCGLKQLMIISAVIIILYTFFYSNLKTDVVTFVPFSS